MIINLIWHPICRTAWWTQPSFFVDRPLYPPQDIGCIPFMFAWFEIHEHMIYVQAESAHLFVYMFIHKKFVRMLNIASFFQVFPITQRATRTKYRRHMISFQLNFTLHLQEAYNGESFARRTFNDDASDLSFCWHNVFLQTLKIWQRCNTYRKLSNNKIFLEKGIQNFTSKLHTNM